MSKLKQKSVLIVEDDQVTCRLVQKILKRAGYTTESVAYAAEAIEWLSQNQACLMLLDYRLPDMCGNQVISALNERNIRQPFIVCTGNGNESVAVEMMKMGALDYLVKSESYLELLLPVVERALKYISQKDKLEQANQQLAQRQAQLVQAEKMASLGIITAGVAHEINNPIGFVKSNVNTLKDYLQSLKKLIAKQDQFIKKHIAQAESDDSLSRLNNLLTPQERNDCEYVLEDVDELLKDTYEGVERVRVIVEELKGFARMDDDEFEKVDINQCIKATLKIVASEVKYKANVTLKLAELPPIQGNPGQLNQVFMNLIMNAADAIKDNGEIRISTQVVDSHTMIQFGDSGVGIAPENISNLFTPFFTTKPIGKGTGLGLYICYDIIQNHGGKIKVKSKLNQGTTFTISLPNDFVKPAAVGR